MTIDAPAIVNRLLKCDRFSQWLTIKIINIQPGSCTIATTVQPEIFNSFGIANGGISFLYAHNALAFAFYSRNKKVESIETSTSHTQQLQTSTVRLLSIT